MDISSILCSILTHPADGHMFIHCNFDEIVLLPLGGELKPPEERNKLSWDVPTLSHLDQRTNKS